MSSKDSAIAGLVKASSRASTGWASPSTRAAVLTAHMDRWRGYLTAGVHRMIDSGGQVIGCDFYHGLAYFGGFVGARREGVFVGDDEIAIVFILQGEAVFEAADVMA